MTYGKKCTEAFVSVAAASQFSTKTGDERSMLYGKTSAVAFVRGGNGGKMLIRLKMHAAGRGTRQHRCVRTSLRVSQFPITQRPLSWDAYRESAFSGV